MQALQPAFVSKEADGWSNQAFRDRKGSGGQVWTVQGSTLISDPEISVSPLWLEQRAKENTVAARQITEKLFEG